MHVLYEINAHSPKAYVGKTRRIGSTPIEIAKMPYIVINVTRNVLTPIRRATFGSYNPKIKQLHLIQSKCNFKLKSQKGRCRKLNNYKSD